MFVLQKKMEVDAGRMEQVQKTFASHLKKTFCRNLSPTLWKRAVLQPVISR